MSNGYKTMSDINTLLITGASYVLKDRCGIVGGQWSAPCSDPKDACRLLQDRGIVKVLPKNFGRFDRASLATLAAVLLACEGGSLSVDQGKQRIGIVGAGQEGSLVSNKAFFADYLSAGRNSARSNLFVYTLPTTPLAEAALFCGFTGPVCYMHKAINSVGRLLEDASVFATQQDMKAVLAVYSDQGETVCFVLQKAGKESLSSSMDLQASSKDMTSVRKIVESLDALKRR